MTEFKYWACRLLWKKTAKKIAKNKNFSLNIFILRQLKFSEKIPQKNIWETSIFIVRYLKSHQRPAIIQWLLLKEIKISYNAKYKFKSEHEIYKFSEFWINCLLNLKKQKNIIMSKLKTI